MEKNNILDFGIFDTNINIEHVECCSTSGNHLYKMNLVSLLEKEVKYYTNKKLIKDFISNSKINYIDNRLYNTHTPEYIDNIINYIELNYFDFDFIILNASLGFELYDSNLFKSYGKNIKYSEYVAEPLSNDNLHSISLIGNLNNINVFIYHGFKYTDDIILLGNKNSFKWNKSNVITQQYFDTIKSSCKYGVEIIESPIQLKIISDKSDSNLLSNYMIHTRNIKLDNILNIKSF